MADVKHTPGPWEIDAHRSYDKHIPVSAGGYTVALVDQDETRSDVAEVNAHLVAAAPDMHAALVLADAAIVDAMDAVGVDAYRIGIEQCRRVIRDLGTALGAVQSAIAKAEVNL